MKFKIVKKQGLVTVRIRLGLSQNQMAEKLGVSKATISMAECGQRTLPTAALLRLVELELKMVDAAKTTDNCLPLAISP